MLTKITTIVDINIIYIYYIPGTSLSSILGFNPPKQGPFQSKQGSFGFQVIIYIIYYNIIRPSITCLSILQKPLAPMIFSHNMNRRKHSANCNGFPGVANNNETI